MGRKGKGRGRGRGRGAGRKRINFQPMEVEDLPQEVSDKNHRSSADPLSSIQGTPENSSENGQSKTSGDTSDLMNNNNIPFETGTRDPVFAYLLPPDVFEMFANNGNRCLKCSMEVEQYYMVLCLCGNFLCLSCFLTECFCSTQDESESDGINQEHDKDLKDDKRLRVSDYETDAAVLTSVEVTLDEEEYQLDCYMYSLRSST